jgi:hypothetical protein
LVDLASESLHLGSLTVTVTVGVVGLAIPIPVEAGIIEELRIATGPSCLTEFTASV